MVNQFLYGRKKAGYCQINNDIMPFHKNELLKIEGLKTYSIADGLNLNDLPHAFYFYNETLDNQYVGILGKTTFVPAGTSEESGSRDTCFLHAYILDGDEYFNALKSPTDLFLDREYYGSVEEYQQRGIPSYRSLNNREAISYTEIEQAFSLDDQKLADFIISCFNAFSDSGKRVYCYLPSNDGHGSKCAGRLMGLILSTMPASINMGAGFLTYAPTFHNPASNPIPGNIGVVFIPDNSENRVQAKYEKDRNYIFDFKNYDSPIEKTEIQSLRNVIDIMVKQINKRNEKTLINLMDFYTDLEKSLKPLSRVNSKFIGAYVFLWMMWINIRKQLAEIKNIPEDELIAWDNYKIYQSRLEGFSLKLKQAAARSIYDTLSYQSILTQYAKNKILNIVNALLVKTDYTSEDLEWIDRIYSGGDLYRQLVIQRLCDYCLSLVENNADTLKILDITNYMYMNEDINSNLIDLIYKERKYYPVAQKLIEATLVPLMKNNKLSIQEKLDKIFNSVKSFYKQYPDLVLDKSFRNEIKKVVEDIIPIPYDYSNVSYVINIIKSLELALQIAFKDILQKACYQMISTIVNNPSFIALTNQQTFDLHRWAKELNLFDYDSLPDYMMTNTLKIFDGRLKRIRIILSIKSGEIIEISRVLTNCSPIELNKICSEMEESIIALVKQYKNNLYNIEEYYTLFVELLKSDVRSIPKEVASTILRVDGISGLRTFYNKVLTFVSNRDYESKLINAVKPAVKNYICFECTNIEFSEADQIFLKNLDLYNFVIMQTSTKSESQSSYKERGNKARDKNLWEYEDNDVPLNFNKRTIKDESTEDNQKKVDNITNIKKTKKWLFGNK